MTEEHFIFPLNTVLFPGGRLPLRIFEQRYLEMTKICLRDARPFGVCLIRDGSEVGQPAVPEQVGCLATIEQWDMEHLGLFQLVVRGGDRFRLHEQRVAPNGLISGSIERLAPDVPTTRIDNACRAVLKLIIERVGEASFPAPLALDDASWIGYRLCEVLPLAARIKQQFLEIDDAAERLDQLREILLKEGLIIKDDQR